jgi:uncharacterized protein (DUF1697 family)
MIATLVTTWVALLRGINLGARNRVPMAELRAALEALGHRDVRTLLASGNVVFAGGRPSARRIEAAVLERTGVRSPVVLLRAAELREVVEQNPLDVPDPKRFLVAFPLGVLPPAPPAEDGARVARGPRALYLDLPGGVRNARSSRSVADAVTTRNWATVLKLLDLAEA